MSLSLVCVMCGCKLRALYQQVHIIMLKVVPGPEKVIMCHWVN
jgi:hypothetical protein